MQLNHAYTIARGLLDQHGLQDWTLTLDNARTRCGACLYDSREISLSRHFIRLNCTEELCATTLHEIAHALAGPGTGHNHRWRSIAARIGAPPRATNTTATMPAPAWGLECRSCACVVARRHRRSLDLARVRCRSCGVREGHLRWIRMA